MSDDGFIADRRRTWLEKPALRAVYGDYFRRILAECGPGPTLEIGAGSSGVFEAAGAVTALDIRPAPWLDVVADAQALPFADASFANIAMLDVLHHLARPRRFLTDAARVLRPGGRLVMMEPAITPLSRPFYKWLHPEPYDMAADPLGEAPVSADDPDDANQAVPTLLFVRRRAAFEAACPMLAVRAVRYLSLWTYPMTGGFRPWSLVPAALIPALLRVEDMLLPLAGRLGAFRLLVVLERRR